VLLVRHAPMFPISNVASSREMPFSVGRDGGVG
jgi:hypothetical protein